MVTTGRCTVRIGDGSRAADVRYKIENYVIDNVPVSDAVKAFILRYLTTIGVDLGRTRPLAWFNWIEVPDAPPTRFWAKCCDPDDFDDVPDDMPQPYDFYIVADVLDEGPPPVARGVNFLHKAHPVLRGRV